MKILHVLPSARAEGTPRIVLDWLEVSGYEQEILFLTNEGELKTRFESKPVWQYYNTTFTPAIKNAFKIARLVERICKERKPEIVIAWPLGFSHWIAMGASRAGVTKNIAHAGNPVGDTFMGKYIHTWISFWIGYYYGNIIIACSEYVRKSFATVPLVASRQLATVYNCIDLSRFKMIDPLAKTNRENDFIMVATLEKHKDHESLLHAWSMFDAEHMNARLFIAGNGSLKDRLVQLSLDLKLKNVFFLGSRDDIPALLWKSKIFVFSTTHQEGFGTVLIEALAAGCMIVASDVPACREVLKDGEYGTLVKAGDVRALCDAMKKSIDQELSPQQLQLHLNYASTFSARNMMEKYFQKVSERHAQ